MTDDELNELLQTGRRFSDAQVDSFDLGSSPLELMEEIMNTQSSESATDLVPARSLAPEQARRTTRHRIVAVIGVAAAAATFAAVMIPGSGGSHPAFAWAATPDEVSGTKADAVDAACRAESSLTLPAASTIDLRGTAGVALYETGDTWQICTFLRSGDGADQATVVAVPALQPPRDLPEDAQGVMRVQTTDAIVNGISIIVATGKCFDICESAVTLTTDAGQGTAPVSPNGTFAAWAPAGSTLSFRMDRPNP